MRSDLGKGNIGNGPLPLALLALALAVIVYATGCETAVCARHSDCAAGQVCSATSTCTVAPDDAGASDASDIGDGADPNTVVHDAPVDADPLPVDSHSVTDGGAR